MDKYHGFKVVVQENVSSFNVTMDNLWMACMRLTNEYEREKRRRKGGTGDASFLQSS